MQSAVMNGRRQLGVVARELLRGHALHGRPPARASPLRCECSGPRRRRATGTSITKRLRWHRRGTAASRRCDRLQMSLQHLTQWMRPPVNVVATNDSQSATRRQRPVMRYTIKQAARCCAPRRRSQDANRWLPRHLLLEPATSLRVGLALCAAQHPFRLDRRLASWRVRTGQREPRSHRGGHCQLGSRLEQIGALRRAGRLA